MRNVLPQNLFHLAENCENPLYVVGGSVRDRKSYRGERVNDETFMPSCLRQGRFFIKLLRHKN
jgi:hypothetical protein